MVCPIMPGPSEPGTSLGLPRIEEAWSESADPAPPILFELTGGSEPPRCIEMQPGSGGLTPPCPAILTEDPLRPCAEEARQGSDTPVMPACSEAGAALKRPRTNEVLSGSDDSVPKRAHKVSSRYVRESFRSSCASVLVYSSLPFSYRARGAALPL